MPPRPEDDSVARVKAALNLVDVVREHVKLRRQGREWVGLCPFHEEKTPSFAVNEQKQSWFCFGCDEGGDMFTFVERIQKTDFRGALGQLAELAGIELAQESAPDRERSRARRAVLEMNQLAAQYYEYVLNSSPAGEPGRELLRRREVDSQTQARFGLGYAPGGRNFATFAQSRGHSLPEARAAGLVRGDGSDFFAERLLVPIRDESGRVLAFTGRTVGTQDPRKYLNSPETAAYVKGRVVFGLDLARSGIERAGHAVLMEGQFDVIVAHRFGVDNAVASSGTAFTEDQLRLLRRFTDEVLLVFDGDEAGRRARYRVVELASAQGMRTRVGELEGAKDPDEYLRGGGSWSEVERLAQPGWEFWLRQVIKGLNPRRPSDFELALRNVNQVLARIEDPAVRESYRRDSALWLGVDEHLVVLRAPASEARRGRSEPSSLPAAAASEARADQGVPSSKVGYLIQVLACRPDALPRVRPLLGSDDLEDYDQAALGRLVEALEAGGEPELNRRLESFPAPLERLVRRAWATPPPALEDSAVDDVVKKIRASAGQRRRLAIIRDLAEAERTGDSLRVADLEARYVSQLDGRTP
ncbi:MAG TPA: DNA primase [Candidatus Nitrosotalea sp.]|nr:DNA primase [Candidatus Nitrosotalea sp.]